MALLPKYSISQSADCTYLDYSITTGNFNINTNPTGYGSPNPTSDATTKYVLKVLQPNATIPYIYTFTVAAGTVTAATETSPLGVITNILADLISTVFPFTAANPFRIQADDLGGIEGDKITDGVYNASIEESGTGPFDVTNDADFLLQCQVCKCKDQQFSKLSPADCNCDCGKIEKLMAIDAFIQAANSAMDVGYSAQAQIDITKATDLCNGNCGCG